MSDQAGPDGAAGGGEARLLLEVVGEPEARRRLLEAVFEQAVRDLGSAAPAVRAAAVAWWRGEGEEAWSARWVCQELGVPWRALRARLEAGCRLAPLARSGARGAMGRKPTPWVRLPEVPGEVARAAALGAAGTSPLAGTSVVDACAAPRRARMG